VVVAQAATGLEDAQAGRKYEVQVRGVPECRCRDADGAHRVRATPADPATAVQIHRVAAGAVGLHIILAKAREQVPVVGRHDEPLNAGRAQLADRPCHVADDGFHDPTGQHVLAQLTHHVNLLRPNDDESRALDLLSESCGTGLDDSHGQGHG
jgi:hypothetical protein